MRSRWLVVLPALLLLAITTSSLRAQTPLYTFNGAAFLPSPTSSPTQEHGVSPMDLAAAVSNSDPGIAGSGDYIAQFTNGGLFVFDKVTHLQVGSTISQWNFWCNGTGLSGCAPTYDYPYDTQIAYDATTGHWIVTALSKDGTTKGEYLYVAASQTADPRGSYYLHAISACPQYTGLFGDMPITGISRGVNGRVAIDLSCGSQTQDELFDIGLGALESGASIDSQCADTGHCRTFSYNSVPPVALPYHLRPSDNLGQNDDILLSSVTVRTTDNVAGLKVWDLSPNPSGVASDTLGAIGGSPFASTIAVMNTTDALAPQPGCTNPPSCEILTDALDPVGGSIKTNAQGNPVYAVAFSAVDYNNVNNSTALTFILNQTSGENNFVPYPVTGGIVGFAQSALDSDGEVVVNRTVFKTTGSHSGIDVINRNPISTAAIVKTYAQVASTTVPLPQGACTTGICRWGDYTAEVYDPDHACDAVQQGQSSECGLFWSTVEQTNGTRQQSQIIAVQDDVLANDTGTITLIGTSRAESECGASPCSITLAAPAGAQNGDLMLVAMSTTFATSYLPTLPAGWTALPFSNQGGSQNFTSTDTNFGVSETGWLLAYTYGSVNPDPGQYTFSEALTPSIGESGGMLLDYRGVNTSVANFTNLSAWGFAASAASATVTVGPITTSPYQQLVTVFKNAGDDDQNGENTLGVTYSMPSGSPTLNVETPLTITGDTWTGLATDAWTGAAGGSFGQYSSSVSYNGTALIGLPLGWMALLPSGLD